MGLRRLRGPDSCAVAGIVAVGYVVDGGCSGWDPL